MRLLLIITAVTFVIGIPFLLWWWKLADLWVSADHKRFHPKQDDTPRVVVRTRVGESVHTVAASNFPATTHDTDPGQPRSDSAAHH